MSDFLPYYKCKKCNAKIDAKDISKAELCSDCANEIYDFVMEDR